MSSEAKSFKFDDFVLDCGDEVLLSGGTPVALTPKTFQLLKLLVQNKVRAVDKQELLNVVWADSFVEEGNVAFTVNRLRKALGDSKDQPRYIETVPRRGYRFIAPVEVISNGSDGDEDPGADASAELARKQRPRPLLIPLIAAAALILLAAGIWLAMKVTGDRSAPILSKPFSVEQLSASGSSSYAAISPDGKYVAYAEGSGGRESIWLRNLDSSENIQIVPPSDDEYFGLTFSSDGRNLFFVRKPGDVHALPALYRVETVGGIPVKLVNNVTERISIAPDDKQIAFVRCQFRKADFCAAFLADIDGQNERRLFTSENGVQIWDVRLSPDGNRLAASKGRYSNEQNDAAVFEFDLVTGVEKEMFSQRFYEIEGIEWLPDGKGLLFTAADFRDGKSSIWAVDRTTGELRTVSKDAASYTKLALDRAGEKLVAVQQMPDFRINVLTGGSSKTFSGARDLAVAGSGRIFYSTFDGEIWTMGADGLGQRQLSNSRAAEYSLCVSPDEKSIYFTSDEGGNRRVWRMNTDGTERIPLTQGVGGFPVAATADGREVYFTNSLGGLLYKVASSGGESVLVHEKMLSSPVVSPDGRLAAHFILENMSRKIAITDLTTREIISSIEPEVGYSFAQTLAWSADGSDLYYVNGKEGKNTLWRCGVRTAEREKMAELADGTITSISGADSGTFTYIAGAWRTNVMLVRGLG